MKLNDEVLEKVKNFTHLGSKMAEDGDVTKEMSTRMLTSHLLQMS